MPSAKADVDAIYVWLLARSAKGAFNWYSALSARLEKLAYDASGCAVAREAHRLKRDLRETYFKTRYGNRYRLIFTIVESEVRDRRGTLDPAAELGRRMKSGWCVLDGTER